MNKKLYPALVWLIIITALSVTPGQNLPKFNLFSIDKVAHLGVHAILVWLLLRGWGQASPREALWVVLFASGYGVLMEYCQYWFVPGRFYEYDDMLANAIGAVLGWGVWRLLR